MAKALDRHIPCRSMLGAHKQPQPLSQRPSRQNVECYASHFGHSSIKAVDVKKKRKFSVERLDFMSAARNKLVAFINFARLSTSNFREIVAAGKLKFYRCPVRSLRGGGTWDLVWDLT